MMLHSYTSAHGGSPDAGAFTRLAALIPPAGPGNSFKAASADLCAELAPYLQRVTDMALATKGESSDTAAVAFLASYVAFCPREHVATVVRRNPASASTVPSLTTRLVGLCASTPDLQVQADARSVLCRLVHALPDVAREVLQRLLSSMASAENSKTACCVAAALQQCIRPPKVARESKVSLAIQTLLGVDLGAAESLLQCAATASGEFATLVTRLLLGICTGCNAALDIVVSARCTVVIMSEAGTPEQKTMSGVELLMHMLQASGGTERSRACATALLGQLAPRTASSGQATATADGDAEDEAGNEATDKAVPVRKELLERGTLEPMVQAVFDISAQWLKAEPPEPPAAGAGGSTRRSARLTRSMSTVRSSRDATHGAAPNFLVIGSCAACVQHECARLFQVCLVRTGEADGLTTVGCKVQASQGEAAPVPAFTAADVAAVKAAQAATVAGVANMAFGAPRAACDKLCKALLRALKGGSAAVKMAACQLLQRVTAVPAARTALYHQQVVPSLIAACATGARHPRMRCTEA
jgi:hypothetical protein